MTGAQQRPYREPTDHSTDDEIDRGSRGLPVITAHPLHPPLTRENVLDGREVAALLDIPLSSVHEYARRGLLPAYKLGWRWVFLRDQIEALLCGKT